ncbi:HAD-IIA family hydrolase [Bradyrhizobium sp. cf659]|uniref:HAD-IIA family hydrolase n=1 Tax=Bradyrhizobium sp. cf659 TaxID=1761771 RepID=UPI0008E75D48|nr:HAD-IIA family hydrolase [Bradyrhizobium sp. cf659]SFJ84308.1 4-nitrophenyl phosphatase [Bradyrhizobium sp. cf659]
MKKQESLTRHIIRGIISDLDGVAYRGDTAIPSSVRAFRVWHEQGVPYAFVTNNSTKSAAQFAAKLTSIGIPAEPRQVFNTISAAMALLARRWPQGTPVFAIGEQPLLAAIEAAGYDLTSADPEVVVLGFDSTLDYAKLRTAIRAALAGAVIIATNPDVLTPVHDGYDPCVGVLTAAVVAAVPSVTPVVVGKPHPFLIERALEYLGTAKHETIMIGDQVATDIAAGNAAGLRSILLASDVPFNAATSIVPDRIVSSLLDLLDATSERAGSLS